MASKLPPRTGPKAKGRAGAAAPSKPARTPGQTVTSKFHRLHDQLRDGFLDKGLKTCDQILSLAPGDPLARSARVQILISLDRFPEALSALRELLSSPPPTGGASLRLAEAYCLYKQNRAEDALRLLEALEDAAAAAGEDGADRGLLALKAQTLYRLERYAPAADLYSDLASTADPSHPEHADLSANLAAAAARLRFASAAPALLASSSSSLELRLPAIDRLESAPIAPLLAPFAPATGGGGGGTAVAGAPKRKLKEPQPLDPQRPAPDPERWLPKRQRTGFVAQKNKRRAKRDKAVAKTATQGSSAPAGALTPPRSAPARHAGGKKKGKH